ncbi:flagellar basal body-associated FliL family protein [Bombella sp. TMW 2.2543]|uniref:Flagellar protein FliL n=1 Tax=Bombella pluederhausensis TaxID=2967336 RepID=A0ABT3WK98_9PROT|nr:flagellar basal body-associated FliL family protein [Bombella pluederhausensis]MCX5618058.1 flagellar basal body-associated FliL family protein [Bombella pluederhausensis]
MSDETAAPAAGEEGNGAPAEGRKGLSRKKLILLSAVPLLLVGGGIGAWQAHLLPFGGSGKAAAHNGQPASSEAASQRLLLSVPSATANLDNGAGRTMYVKMTASVEVEGAQNLTALQARIPEIQDIFQTYLHESRPQDLHGSGFYRLREALLRRLRVAFAPLTISNIYITELLTQ